LAVENFKFSTANHQLLTFSYISNFLIIIIPRERSDAESLSTHASYISFAGHFQNRVYRFGLVSATVNSSVFYFFNAFEKSDKHFPSFPTFFFQYLIK
jgi:hypothetical protein